MFHSTRFKLIISFLSVSLLVGLVSLLVGGQLLYKAVLNEATNRIRLDLNAAREIYLARIKCMTVALNITTLGPGFRSALKARDAPQLVSRLMRVAQNTELDFAGIVTNEGETLCRIGPDSIPEEIPPNPPFPKGGTVQADNPLASFVLKHGCAVSGTVILSKEFLFAENPEFAEQARIRLLPTPRAAPRPEVEETSGMALAAAIVSQGNLSPELGPISKSEIGVLEKTFKEMLSSLRERDRRQRAESEIKLQQSEKQASVGRLAAGVAHEINNPLTGVLTFTHMLLRRKDINDEIRSDLQTIAQETERVRKIVRGLLDFSRQTQLDLEPTDVNGLVRSTIEIVENQALIGGVSLDFKPGEGLPVCNLDRSQLQSVLLNIIINALDATEPGGNIVVSTGLSISTSKTEKKGIEIAITDTGCGIALEDLDKLFDPFFTTKEVGQGTGLGLSVSLGIAERHGGTIRVRSEVGRGSTFTIWLPVEEESGEHEDTGC